jgi:hypothetical protein
MMHQLGLPDVLQLDSSCGANEDTGTAADTISGSDLKGWFDLLVNAPVHQADGADAYDFFAGSGAQTA